jgi:hypothetical protein
MDYEPATTLMHADAAFCGASAPRQGTGCAAGVRQAKLAEEMFNVKM